MAEEFEAKIIQDFAQDIGRKVAEAAVLTRTMEDFYEKGLPDRAFRSLLEVEPLLHDVLLLLNASSLIRRRDRSAVFD